MPQAIATAAQAEELVGAITGGIGPTRGAELFAFVREHGFTSCLELGFAHGVSTVYIAAGLEAGGAGSLTSVDLPSALERSPSAIESLHRAGLERRVSLVIDPDGYLWWLRKKMRERMANGQIEPAYDFIFIDGAHTWDIDALAFSLVDRLLVPGGWILFDDLDWVPSDRALCDVPEDTRQIAHVREIWDLLVATSHSYDMLRIDGSWGYARKSLAPFPSQKVVVKHEIIGQTRALVGMVRRAIKR